MFRRQRNDVFPWTLACVVRPHRVKHLIRVITRESPNDHPFTVQKEYIIAFDDKSELPVQALFVSPADKLKGLTLCVADTRFGNYTQGHWMQRVS